MDKKLSFNKNEGSSHNKGCNRGNIFVKKFNLIFLVLICLVTLASYSFAANVNTQSDYLYPAEISGYRFLPSTITSGNVVSVAVDIYNKGSLVSMDDIILTLDINTGDYLEPVEESSTIINSISKGSTKTAVLKFKVNESTPPGYYNLFLKMSFKRTDYKGNAIDVNQTNILIVPVSASQESIGIEINPKVISPGNQTQLMITLTNHNSNPISNISFYWTESNEVIVPLGSDNKRFISYIGPNEKYDINYLVVADPSIVTGVYPINTNLTYVSSNGEKTQSSEVGVIIGGKTDFQVSQEMTTNGTISFSIANIGSNTASSVIVQLPPQNGLSVSGSDTVILGSISKGDYSVASFGVTANQFDANSMGSMRDMPNSRVRNENDFGNPFGQRVVNQEIKDNNIGSNQIPKSNFEQNYILISYTDTTGERQTIKHFFQLNSGVGFSKGINTTQRELNSFNNSTNQSLSNLFLILPAIIFISIVAVLYNKFYAKKNWKQFFITTLIGWIILLLVMVLVPNQLIVLILAILFLVSVFFMFFKLIEKIK
ncbi:MAG: hypothetical protein BWY55_00410 [archaeon ADurb.Bin336]|nr:MAG: hypothetical protein BWY55_00410 [archaeon ADurb.Bin336]